MLGFRNAISFLVAFFANYATCTHLWRCCYLYISSVHFLTKDIPAKDCVERCSDMDKFAAIGDITFERNASGIVKNFGCFCIPDVEQCIEMPSTYCFSRLDSAETWMPTGGPPLLFSIYTKCMPEYYGPDCDKRCLCQSLCAPASGKCPQKDCAHIKMDSQGIQCRPDCTLLSGQCKSLCENNATLIECSCDKYEYYDLDLNQCKVYQACGIHKCSPVACRTDRLAQFCDCDKEPGTYETLVYGLPFCRKKVAPCLDHTCETGNAECHEDSKGRAICFCEGGGLPEENGDCLVPITLPAVRVCHGYLNQGFYYKCLCHDNYIVSSMNKCERDTIEHAKGILPCFDMPMSYGIKFCLCPPSCDRSKVCNTTDTCSVNASCKKCQVTHNNLLLNHTFGGIFYVTGPNNVFVILGPSEMKGEEGTTFSYQQRGVWNPLSGRLVNLTIPTVVSPTAGDYLQFRIQKGASTFLTYPIYLADLPPLTYDYEFEDGFSKILNESFGSYSIVVRWRMPGAGNISWYCTRSLIQQFKNQINMFPCYKNGSTFLRRGMTFAFEENKLLLDEGSTFTHYFVYAVPQYRFRYLPELVKRITVKKVTDKDQFRLDCLENCDPYLNALETLKLKVQTTGALYSIYSCKWKLPPGEVQDAILDRETLTLVGKQLRRLEDGNITFIVIIFNSNTRMSFHFKYDTVKMRLARKNCSITPTIGFGLVTRFTTTCSRGFHVKIMSGLCGKRKDVTLLKFKGTTDRPIENLIFSIGDPHDYYYRCIYVIDSELVDDVESVKFKVIKNLTYVTNFQYLGNLRMDSLSTIIVIGNAIEFFNDNPATDELDVEYRVKCRELLLDLIMLNWNKLEDQLLEMETIKLIYLLLANPLEIDPIYVVDNMNLFEMIDASKLWTTDNFNLTDEEYSTSLLHLTESLSYILYSAYVRYNESHDVRSKRVLSYVLDNLAYLGNYYVNQVTKNRTKMIATSVFTLYLQKFDLRTNETMQLSVDDGESQFLIKIPTTPSLKKLDTEVTMKLVIFPFNPLALTTGSLFTPTVSVSLYAEGSYLPLKNLLTPVVIKVPTETSEWLTYSGRFGIDNSVTFVNLPTTLFNNTLYKLKINVKFERVIEDLRRVSGVLVMILCEGSSWELEERVLLKDYRQCHEIAFKRINFYREAERTFNMTLPPMFMQYTQTGLIYTFITSDKVEYTLTFSMIQLSCQYWYEPDERSSYGCAVSPIHTTDETLVCLCYHLSMFTADTKTESPNMDITSIFGDAIQESVSRLGIVTIVSLWIFFITFGIWAKKMDQKLAILAYPVDLADNYPNAEYVYLVAVETGIRPFAGCDGTVFLVLIGTLNKSLSHKLVCKRYITLQTGHQNYFIIRATEPLGKVTQVRLWIVDETQSNKKINWYVNQVTVFDLQFRDAYVFICDEWMGVNMKGVNNDMTFFAATSLMLNEFNNIFTMNFFKGFVENHVWFSIFTNPILSRFTRFQRVATCKLNTHLYLLTTLLFQKLQRPSARSGTIFYTIFKDVALTIIIGILMSPLFWFFDVLFSQSRKRKVTHNIISDWNRNIGTKKKEDEPEEELALTRVADVIINFLSKIFKGPAGAEVQEEAEFDMYDENPNVATTGLAFNQFQQMMETTDDQINLSNNKIRVFPTFQRNYNAKPKSENTSVYNTRPKRQSRISHIESLDSFSSEYDKESGKSSKSGKSVHTVSDIAKGLLQEEIIGEKTKLLMKTLIEQRGGKLKKKMRKYHVETVEGHLPWWMNFVAWIFLTITICVTSFFIFVLIKQNVSEITADWFVRVFITLLANIFVIDPICIVVGAFCRSLVSRQYIHFPLGRLGVIKREALLNLTHYYDYHKRRVYKLRKSPFYKSPIMIKKKIKVEKKMKLSKLLLLNIILFSYLIACAMIISMSMYDYSMFLAKYSVERLLVGRHIKEIKERDQYYHWLRNHLIPNIYGPEANLANLSKVFSRSLNFQPIASVNAYAINYPCFTRIGDQKSWADYHNDPEWYEFETICMGYSRGLGLGCIDVMENNSFFNFNFMAMGTTFYIYIPAVQSIAWIFIAAHQPMGGGFKVTIEEVFLVSHSPIPFEQPRVAVALIMFWPAFGFSLFRNMKRFFYVGAGRYFSNFWNILDLASTFMVLMISIIYVFVIHGISDVFSEFYLSTGDLYVTFYISGVVGILFLIYLMTFIIVIRVIELLKLNHLQRIFQLCLAQALKIFCLLVIKFSCVAMGLIYLKMCFFSEYKEEYAQINQRFIFFIYDMVHPRKVLGMDANYHMASIVVLLISIFSGTLKAFIISDIVLTYRRLRRYQSRNKELRNLIEYLKTLMLDLIRWSSALLSGKRPPKKHRKKKGMFYRPFTARKDSSDMDMRSLHGSFVKPVEL